ncbi:MAG TPA: hypothetical protein VGG01_17250 [Xanthobacteraceae bacterium]
MSLLLTNGGIPRALGWVDNGIIISLAMALAWRFRDIGWPVWIGPTILLGTMLGLPVLVLGYAIANHAPDVMASISLAGLVSVPVNVVLLIVAGSVPGKPASGELAQVFE